MDANKIILKIIQLPATFKLMHNRSMISSVQETGYFKMHDEIDEFKIKKIITLHPEYIKDWLQYSDDQRTSPSWYFKASLPSLVGT